MDPRPPLTLVDDIHVSKPAAVSAHDCVNVRLHDVLEVVGVCDVLHPLRELRVPYERVTSND
jgi:hypothetical protein